MSVNAVWMGLLVMMCCLDHMAWANAAGVQRMVHKHVCLRTRMLYCTHDIMHITEDKFPGNTHVRGKQQGRGKAHHSQTVTTRIQTPNHTQQMTDRTHKVQLSRTGQWRCETKLPTHQSLNLMFRAGMIRQALTIINKQEPTKKECGVVAPGPLNLHPPESGNLNVGVNAHSQNMFKRTNCHPNANRVHVMIKQKGLRIQNMHRSNGPFQYVRWFFELSCCTTLLSRQP
jgi:hypothetical protein